MYPLLATTKVATLVATALELGRHREQEKGGKVQTAARLKRGHIVRRFNWILGHEDPFSAQTEAHRSPFEDALSDPPLLEVLASTDRNGSTFGLELRDLAAQAGKKRAEALKVRP